MGWRCEDTGAPGCTTLLAKPSWGEDRHYQQEARGCSHVAASGSRPLPANLCGVNTARGKKTPRCRPRPKGLVGAWQLKVQISLPYCSLREWPCLCNTEDVLNGSESSCNHGWCVPASVYHQALLWVKQSLEGESSPHRFLLAQAGTAASRAACSLHQPGRPNGLSPSCPAAQGAHGAAACGEVSRTRQHGEPRRRCAGLGSGQESGSKPLTAEVITVSSKPARLSQGWRFSRLDRCRQRAGDPRHRITEARRDPRRSPGPGPHSKPGCERPATCPRSETPTLQRREPHASQGSTSRYGAQPKREHEGRKQQRQVVPEGCRTDRIN